MSTALAFDPARRPGSFLPTPPVRPAEAPAESPAAAPSARPVARPNRRLAAGAVGLAGIGAVLVGQLLISIGNADGAYRLASLRAESSSLERQQQVAEERLRADAAPQRLASLAVAQGLVPDVSPAYLDARTGRVLGSPSPATGKAEKPGGITR